MEARYPHQLSGGQQQRVALARMMISRPQVLMLDEPFSALDAYLREEMQLEVSRMLEEYQGITLLVSHDRDEIYRLSDQIAIYDRGRIVRIGDKQEVFLHPQICAAATMTGCKNVFPAYACGTDAIRGSGLGCCIAYKRERGCVDRSSRGAGALLRCCGTGRRKHTGLHHPVCCGKPV